MYFQISQSNYSDLRQLSEMSKPANLSKLNYTCQFAGDLFQTHVERPESDNGRI